MKLWTQIFLFWPSSMGLSPAEQADINELYHKEGTQVAMTKCLILWKKHSPFPFAATYKALLELLLRLKKERIAFEICQHLTQCEYNTACACIPHTMHTAHTILYLLGVVLFNKYNYRIRGHRATICWQRRLQFERGVY